MSPEEYPIQLAEETDDDGKVWFAECRELACKVHGDSPAEAISFLREIIAEKISDYLERGETPPVPLQFSREYSGKLVIRISPLLHGQIASEAEALGVSLNSRIIEILASRNKPADNARYVINAVVALGGRSTPDQFLISTSGYIHEGFLKSITRESPKNKRPFEVDIPWQNNSRFSFGESV